MANEAEILNPVRAVRVGAVDVAVRELKWSDALKFLQSIGEYGNLLFDKDGNFHFTIESLGQIIAETEELSGFLIQKSTGKDQDWINDLDLSHALDLIEAALLINLEVVKKKGRTITASFKVIPTPGMTTSSATPSPSDSKTSPAAFTPS